MKRDALTSVEPYFFMVNPEFKEFSRLARSATLVPVVKSVSADLLTPVSAFLAIAEKEPHAFLLESVERGEQIGRYTFLECGLTCGCGREALPSKFNADGSLSDARAMYFKWEAVAGRASAGCDAGGCRRSPPGLWVIFSYDVVRQLENIGERAKDDLSLPDSELMFF